MSLPTPIPRRRADTNLPKFRFPIASLLTLILAGCSAEDPPPQRLAHRATFMQEALEAPEKIRILDLFNRRLPGFPPEIFKMQHLDTLILRTCKIGELPAEIQTLQSLSRLDLGETSLTNLTPTVLTLPRLTQLWLNDNLLNQLPSGFNRLSQLTYLNLDRNQLTELPADFGTMSSLIWLRLNHNRLTHLPRDLSGLKHTLKTLYLLGNPIPAAEQQRIRAALPDCTIYFD
jgi:Leucine-rich repeat (LRR) protein